MTNKKPRNKNIGLIALVVLAVLAVGYFGGLRLEAGEQIYRPIWGSIGCELTGATPGFTKQLNQDGATSFTCLGSNCKITHVNQATCGWMDQRIVHGSVGYGEANNYEELTQLTGNQGDQFNVHIRCFNPVYYAVCSAIPTFGTLFNQYCMDISTNPSSGSVQGYWNGAELKRFQDGAKFHVSGGGDCYVASTKTQFNPLQPYDESKAAMWKSITQKTILGQLVGTYLGGDEGTININPDGAEYLPLGKYIPYIVEWKPISPILQNVYNPTDGKFSGKEVICDTALTKMYQLETISTPSGSYKIPTKDLGYVGCCNNVDCYGNYQNPICGIESGTFECEPKSGECQTPCVSDLQCPGNVFRKPDGTPYVLEGMCVSNCCEYTEKQVQCINDLDCPARYGYIAECKLDNTCVYILEEQKTPCPYDCCSGRENHYVKSCVFGLSCCWENDVWGNCKTVCDAECMTYTDCDDNNPKTIDKCVYGECKHELILETEPCEEQCTTHLDLGIYKTSFIDPFCYAGCIINMMVKETLHVTYTLIKFILVLVVMFVVVKLGYKEIIGKSKKKKKKEVAMIMAMLISILAGYVLWMVI